MNFSDPLDQASQHEERFTSSAVAAAMKKSAPEQKQVDGKWETTECVDCGEDIEPARLAHARVRCFACQDAKEKRGRMYGGGS